MFEKNLWTFYACEKNIRTFHKGGKNIWNFYEREKYIQCVQMEHLSILYVGEEYFTFFYAREKKNWTSVTE